MGLGSETIASSLSWAMTITPVLCRLLLRLKLRFKLFRSIEWFFKGWPNGCSITKGLGRQEILTVLEACEVAIDNIKITAIDIASSNPLEVAQYFFVIWG
jgi:hypothetical protein